MVLSEVFLETFLSFEYPSCAPGKGQVSNKGREQRVESRIVRFTRASEQSGRDRGGGGGRQRPN